MDGDVTLGAILFVVVIFAGVPALIYMGIKGPESVDDVGRRINAWWRMDRQAALARRSVWYPNRKQWFVIWIAYAAAFWLNVIEGSSSYSGSDTGVLTTFIVVGAALLVWQLSGGRSRRHDKNE